MSFLCTHLYPSEGFFCPIFCQYRNRVLLNMLWFLLYADITEKQLNDYNGLIPILVLWMLRNLGDCILYFFYVGMHFSSFNLKSTVHRRLFGWKAKPCMPCFKCCLPFITTCINNLDNFFFPGVRDERKMERTTHDKSQWVHLMHSEGIQIFRKAGKEETRMK